MDCLIVDDSADFLASVVPFLEAQGVSVAGCARTSAEALALVARAQVTVALVDVYLGDEDGIALVGPLRRAAPSTTVVLISTHDGDEVAELVAASGAAGFLRKDSLTVEAIRALLV